MEKYVAALMAIAVATASLFLVQEAVEPANSTVKMEALMEAEAVEEAGAAMEAETVIEEEEIEVAEAIIEPESMEETEAVEAVGAVTRMEAMEVVETGEAADAVEETEAVEAAGAVIRMEAMEAVEAVETGEAADAVEETEAVEAAEAIEATGANELAKDREDDWPFADIAPGSAIIFYGEAYNDLGTVIVGADEGASDEIPDVYANDIGDTGDADDADEIGLLVPDEEDGEEEPIVAGGERPDVSFDADQWASLFNESWSGTAAGGVAFEMLDGEEIGGYRDYIAGWVDDTITVDVYEAAEEGQLWTAVTIFEEDIPQGEESAYLDYFVDAILSCVRADGVKIDGQTAENFGRYIRGAVESMRTSGGEQPLLEFTYEGLFFSVGYDEQGKIADCYIIY